MQTSKKTNSVHVVRADLAHSKIFFFGGVNNRNNDFWAQIDKNISKEYYQRNLSP